ncbi:hypothetical protein BH09SUM1_BH09SUM1_01020 [soil metagenome]
MTEGPLPISVEWFPELSDNDGDVPVSVDVFYIGDTSGPEHKALRTAAHNVLRDLRRADRMALVDHLRSHGFASLNFMAMDLPIGELAALGVFEITRQDKRQKGFQARAIGINRSLITMHDKGVLVCNLVAVGLIALLLQMHGSSTEAVTSENLRQIANEGKRFDLGMDPVFVSRYAKTAPVQNPHSVRQVGRKFGDLFLTDGRQQLPGVELIMELPEDQMQHLPTLEEGIGLFVDNMNVDAGHQVISFLRQRKLHRIHVVLSHMKEFNTDIAFGITELRDKVSGEGHMQALVGDQALRGPDPVLHTRLSVAACFAQILVRAEGSDPRSLTLHELGPWIERLGCPVPWKKDS